MIMSLPKVYESRGIPDENITVAMSGVALEVRYIKED